MKTLNRKGNLSSSLRFIFVLLTVLVMIGTAEAANYTVTTTNESGAGSLRDAIGQANANPGADTINFTAGVTGTITLASLLPTITGDLTISGPGAGVLTMSGNHLYQVFNIATSVTVSISGLTISNGLGPPDGGGIYNAGTLTITNSTFSGNSGRAGGGIYNAGTLTIANSTFTANSATVGGGVSNNADATITNSTFSGNIASAGAGGINNTGTMTVTNSTISGNAAGLFGGGIYNNAGTMMISNSTLSGNSAPDGGGGIYNGGTATFKNSIIANSPTGGNCAGSAVIAAGVNFSTDGTCGAGFMQVTPGQLNLGPLQDNGGPTLTHALLPGSAAIDAVTDCTDLAGNPVTTDQRGNNRPQDGDLDGIESCDAGSFESPMPILVECSRGDAPTVSCPGDITVAPTSLSGALVTYTAPVCLDCDCDHQTPIQIAGLASGSTFPVGTTVNTYLVTDGGQTGTCSFSVTVAPSKCPLPQGYWKNNPSAWPVSSLILGDETYNQAELLAILNTPIGTGKNSDASLILAYQLIAAKLNIANGSHSAPISATVTAADALLAPFSAKLPYLVKSSSAVGQQMIPLAALLERYNKTLLTPGCTP